MPRTFPLFREHPAPFQPVEPIPGAPNLPRYRAMGSHIVDGDTFDAIIDLGFGVYTYQAIRLADVDTPEIFAPSSIAEASLGDDAKEFTGRYVQDQPIILFTKPDERSFGRWVAHAYVDTEKSEDNPTWESLSDLLREHNLTKEDVQG